MATFTEDEVREAVMTYSEGCTPGKITFLREAFNIEAQCEMVVELTVRITMDAYNGQGKINEHDVKCELESLIDCELGGRIDSENVDARVSLD